MMEAVALVLGAVLAILAVAAAALPFLTRTGAADRVEEGADDRIRLADERDRALAALKELEFDHRTGKVSDADYRALVGPLRREAAAAIRALDGMMRPAMATPDPARVPEPWPPPDEGDLPDPAPTPAPGEPTPGPEEPAPPQHPPLPGTSARPQTRL